MFPTLIYLFSVVSSITCKLKHSNLIIMVICWSYTSAYSLSKENTSSITSLSCSKHYEENWCGIIYKLAKSRTIKITGILYHTYMRTCILKIGNWYELTKFNSLANSQFVTIQMTNALKFHLLFGMCAHNFVLYRVRQWITYLEGINGKFHHEGDLFWI